MQAFYANYWDAHPLGTTFNTHELRGALTGQIQIDKGITVKNSKNARVGTFHSKKGDQFGVFPLRKKVPYKFEGRDTTTTIWVKA